MSDPEGAACIEVMDRLDDFLDGNLSPRELALVSHHFLACVCCARRMRFEACMLETLRSRLRRIEIPAHLRTSITLRLCLESGGE